MMRVGLIGSGYDMLPLLQSLEGLDIEWHVFCDTLHRPLQQKSAAVRKERTAYAMDYMKEKVDVMILSPEAELLYAHENTSVLPFFRIYLLEEVLPYSLVGKI
jgi:hypothetical protein